MPNRRTIVALVLVVAVAGWFVYQRYFTFIENRNPSGENIIALGDSITAGFGVPRESIYVSRLEEMFGVKIINAGVSGDTTGDAMMRFERDVLAKDPKVVLIELGGNDFLQGVDNAKTRDNLADMIARVERKGAAVVLIGVGGTMGAGGVPSMMKDLARQYDTACVPNILKGLFGDSKYMIDRVHPNAAGHKRIAEMVARELEHEIPSVFRR